MSDLFCKTAAGDAVHCVVLRNAHGIEARVITLGATLISLKMPDKQGVAGEVILGCADAQAWLDNPFYFGASCGRYCNRIGNARFELNGEMYRLRPNEGKHILHGGADSLSRRLWTIDECAQSFVQMNIISEDGDQGFPGRLQLTVRYELHDDNSLVINYWANTDAATVVAFTNHAYFNLLDGGATDVLEHQLWINADRVVQVDSELIPTGVLLPLEGSAYNFKSIHSIGRDMATVVGYDNCWVINGKYGELRHALTLSAAASGRVLEVWTTESGVQLYSGNDLNGFHGAGGIVYNKYAGLAIEAQALPDSPNQPEFPSTTLAPGDTYHQVTVYRFKW